MSESFLNLKKERNFGLDVLRATAITLVVVSHCTYLFIQESNNPFILFIRTLGAVGVDLFFVLSGFLIGGILLREIEQKRTGFNSLMTFWKRRWWRTLPNYFLMLLINIAVFYVFFNDLPDSIASYFVFFQNFSGVQSDFFTESWSLSIEEYAYLILPFLLFCALFISKKHEIVVFLWTTLFVILVMFLVKIQFYVNAEIVSYKDWSASFRKVVIYRLDAIYIGFLLAYMMRNRLHGNKKMNFALLFLGAFIFTGMHFLIYALNLQPQTHLEFYVFMYLPLISICCALIFPFAIDMERNACLNRLVYFVSTRSYAIYLVNFSAILLCMHYLVDFESATLFMKMGFSVMYLILTLSFSNLIFVYFEKPILNYRDRKFR